MKNIALTFFATSSAFLGLMAYALATNQMVIAPEGIESYYTMAAVDRAANDLR